jgi:L-alanine-DL-glutamate epimerase-like enolase superfamily enzyme
MLLVRVETDEGIVGFGEASPFALVTGCVEADVLNFLDAMNTRLAGVDALALERVHGLMDEYTLGNAPGKAAIDIALHDIWGKYAGMPLYRLLGGGSNTVISDMTIGIDEPRVMAAEARRYVDKGFTILKIKVGLDPVSDLEAVRLIREEVGPAIDLRIDANQGWTTKQTLATLRAMERYGVHEVEQPLAADDLDGLRFVRERASQDVMLDETVHTPRDAWRALSAGAADIINIKLMKSGGLYPACRINAVAQAAGVPCMVGCMNESRVGIAAGAALVAALDNIRYADLDSYRLFDELPGVTGGFEQTGGTIRLTEEPGLGVEIALDFG